MKECFNHIVKCHHCGVIHEGRCPEVKSIEYYPDGTTKKVEYFAKDSKTFRNVSFVDTNNCPYLCLGIDKESWFVE